MSIGVKKVLLLFLAIGLSLISFGIINLFIEITLLEYIFIEIIISIYHEIYTRERKRILKA
jgi:hypothetical protein